MENIKNNIREKNETLVAKTNIAQTNKANATVEKIVYDIPSLINNNNNPPTNPNINPYNVSNQPTEFTGVSTTFGIS